MSRKIIKLYALKGKVDAWQLLYENCVDKMITKYRKKYLIACQKYDRYIDKLSTEILELL